MSKDGTNRGGLRLGAGAKGKSVEKFVVPEIDYEEMQGDMPDGEDLGVLISDIPEPSEYLTDEQKDGTKLEAGRVYRATYEWLTDLKCEKIVSQQLVEQYAMSVARWIQCERAISKFGLVGKHPTTKAPIASPFVGMSREYKKQVNADFYQIYIMVRDNSDITNDIDDDMEDLLD